MFSTINVCFMCISDKNCTDVSAKVLSLVEYILPEITITKMDVTLRICSVCEETISLFGKFKGSCLKNSMLLETTIKKAQSYRDTLSHLNKNNSVTSAHNQSQEKSLKPKSLPTPQIANYSMDDDIISITSEEDDDMDIEEISILDEILEDDDNKNVVIDSKTPTKKAYSCRICKKVYRYKFNAVSHMKSHKGMIEYKCAVCDQEFGNRTKLLGHVLIHTSNKKKINRLSCTSCNKTFMRHGNLQRHIRSHQKQRPCDVQKMASMRPRKAVNYKEKKDTDKKFKCQTCKKGFQRRSDLQYHTIWHVKKK